jgi:hypothetical protein
MLSHFFPDPMVTVGAYDSDVVIIDEQGTHDGVLRYAFRYADSSIRARFEQ